MKGRNMHWWWATFSNILSNARKFPSGQKSKFINHFPRSWIHGFFFLYQTCKLDSLGTLIIHGYHGPVKGNYYTVMLLLTCMFVFLQHTSITQVSFLPTLERKGPTGASPLLQLKNSVHLFPPHCSLKNSILAQLSWHLFFIRLQHYY